MIIPSQIATMGLYPGWDTFMTATLGHWFGVEIEIEDIDHGTVAFTTLTVPPRPPTSGAPGAPQVIDILDLRDLNDSRRCVKITVTLKRYSWSSEMMVNSIILDKFNVSVTGVRQIRKKIIEVLASVCELPKDIVIKANVKAN